jgi:predicted exporter
MAAALGLSLVVLGPVKLNVNLFDILSGSHSLKTVEAPEKALSDKNGRQTYILAGNPDFASAKHSAAQVYEALSDSGAFESLSLYIDERGLSQFTEYLYKYRYMLLDAETRNLLETGGASRVAEEALGAAFGVFTISLDTLETDPFLLVNRGIQRFLASALLAGGRMQLREETLAAQYEGLWYVLLRGTLTPAGVALTNKNSGARKIYEVCNQVKEKNPATVFVYSGLPFHSYESSSKAQREIFIISGVTMGVILLLFWRVFRSLLPVIISAAGVVISILFALGTSLLFFREMHILTFVFGTTLIGIGVDYSIHFFIHWKGRRIEAQVFRGIAMSFASTAICFIALGFAPFPILKQFACFSAAGLASSFLSVMCLYPRLAKNFTEKTFSLPRIRFSKTFKTGLLIFLIGGLAVTLFLNKKNIRIENNLADLYTMSEALGESERIAAQVLNHGSSGRYFIVSGDSPEETLSREELLRDRLEIEIVKGNLQSYAAVSLFIPSIRTQQSSYTAGKALLSLAEAQYEILGFPAETAETFRQDFAEARDRYILPDGELPQYLDSLISNLWIPTPAGYFSCVLPLHTQDESVFRDLAGEIDGVFFINKTKDLSAELDALTREMLLLFFAAYILIALLVRGFYAWKPALRICGVPFFPLLTSVAILGGLNIPLGFFGSVGLLLVFGLGLDYMFYLTESENVPASHSRTIGALGLSFGTTALSFGALALSSFVPVHIFGLTVFIGLSSAFMASLLLRK